MERGAVTQRYRRESGQACWVDLPGRLRSWGYFSVPPAPILLGAEHGGAGGNIPRPAAHYSLRHIAAALGRPPSTVSREVARHGGRQGYQATQADVSAWEQARRPKRCRLADQPRLRRLVADKLAGDWSPEHIVGWLKRLFPEDTHRRISHETIYRSLFIQTRGGPQERTDAALAVTPHNATRQACEYRGAARGQIIDGISIRERPATSNDRAIPGHWEGDLLSGSNNTHMATLVERQSRLTLLVTVAGKDTASVVNALIPHVQRLPVTLRRSLTWDRGMEMAAHKQLTVATQVKVYFCDPHSPWQRGTNENTHRLLRQYFPKGTDLARYSQQELDHVALRLNQRPRKTLAFQKPAEKLQEGVAMTG